MESGTLGTPLYMAPEQARRPADVDARADVFATAVTIHALLHGRPAFEAGSIAAVIARVLSEPLPLLENALQLPRGFDALLADASAKNPAQRPADAGAFLVALQRLATAPGPRLHRLRVLKAVLSVSVLLGVPVWWMLRTTEDENVAVMPTFETVMKDSMSPSVVPTNVLQPDNAASEEEQRAQLETAERNAALLEQARVEEEAQKAAFVKRLTEALAVCGVCDEILVVDRAGAEALVTACVLEQGGEATLRAAERIVVAEARQVAVERLVGTTRTAFDAAVSAALAARTSRDFAGAMEILAQAGLRFGAKVPGAEEDVRQVQSSLRSEELERTKALMNVLDTLEVLIVRKAEAPVLTAQTAVLAAALAAMPLRAIDPASSSECTDPATDLLRTLAVLPELRSRAMARSGALLNSAQPLRVRGEPPRGLRKLRQVSEDLWEFEREVDGQRSSIAWRDMDASTQVELAGVKSDPDAALLILLGRLEAGDVSTIWESLQTANPSVTRLAQVWRVQSRQGLGSELEIAAADALTAARIAVACGDFDQAVQHAAQVNALRAKSGGRGGAAWLTLLREGRAISERCAPLASRLAEWRNCGWAANVDWDARSVCAIPAVANGALSVPVTAAVSAAGCTLLPATDFDTGAELRLPAGEWTLELGTPGFSGMLLGSWGSDSFVAIGRSVEPRGANGIPLHGLERDIVRTLQVHRAVAFKAALRTWADAWPQAVPFSIPERPAWRFERIADGKRRIQCGTSALDLPSDAPKSGTTVKLLSPEPLRLEGVRLSAPLEIRF